MATWAELTAEQQAQFSAWMDQMLRPVAGEVARVLYHLDVTKAAYNATAVDIYNLLNADAVIPNTGGLSGAIPLTKTQLGPMLAALASLLTDYYTEADQELYVKLAGGPNVLG